jgi:hypothetical protein
VEIDGLDILCNQVETDRLKEEEARERKLKTMRLDVKLA